MKIKQSKIFTSIFLAMILFLISLIIPIEKATSNVIETNVNNSNIDEINVGIITNEFFIGSGWEKYEEILKDYKWTVGDKTYIIKTHRINDKTIYSGELTPENYDIVVMSGGGGGDHSTFTKTFKRLPNVNKWRENFINFIESGGSYYGTCSGIAFLLRHDRKAETFYEVAHNLGSLDISCFEMHCAPMAIPPISQFLGVDADKTGSPGYVLFSGWNLSKPLFCGIPMDVPIDRSHPIFNDCQTDTTRITWIGGPSIVYSDNIDRQAHIIANFPDWEICENDSVKIKSWEYTGGIKGIIKSFFNIIKSGINPIKHADAVMMDMSDWECTGEIIKTDVASRGFMSAEVYPNENQGRIVLISGHPECKVWWGGHIIDYPDTDSNNLYDGFHGWVDTIPFEETIEDEKTYSHWIIRRSIAWGAKIPECNLPPVYGPSQVQDLENYQQTGGFVLTAINEAIKIPYNLELFYRHSSDNETWTEWKLYGKSLNKKSWDFYPNFANGNGFYQFVSIRTDEYEDTIVKERFPPGPDAIAQVI